MNRPHAIRIAVALLTISAALLLSPGARSSITPYWSKTFDAGTGNPPNDAFVASPAIAPDGTVYIAGAIADSSNGNQRRLYAINGSTGAILTGWPLFLGARTSSGHTGRQDDKGMESTAAIGTDGMLYIGSWTNAIYKVNPSTRVVTSNVLTGTLKGVLRNAPIIANGYLYCWVNGDPAAQTPNPHLVILNPSDMSLVGYWPPSTANIYGEAIASPALGRDNKIYFCTLFVSGVPPNHELTGHVYAIDVSTPSSLSKIWDYPTGCIGPIIASPLITADGKVYVFTQPGQMSGTSHPPSVICFDPASSTPGIPIWTRTTTGNRAIDGTPAIGRFGHIYIPNDIAFGISSSLSAIVPRDQTDGLEYTAEWDVPFSGEKFDSAPVVTADESIFAKTITDASPQTATLRMFDASGQLDSATLSPDTKAWHIYPSDGGANNGGIAAAFSSPAIAPDGKIYIATAGETNTTTGVPIGKGAIYCFNNGPTSPGFWPNFRGNQFNTANIQDNGWTTNTIASTLASITPLSSYPSSGNATANAVSDRGTAVGFQQANGHNSGVYWSVNTQIGSALQSLSGLGQYYPFVAYGLNYTNQAVGYQTMSTSPNPPHAIFWSALTNAPTDITPANYLQAHAYGISIKGVIAGDAQNSSAYWRAMKWYSPSTSGIDLGTLGTPANNQSYAFGGNSRGWVFGKAQQTATGPYLAFAIPPSQNSMFAVEELNSSSSASEAHGMNGLGQVVGSFVSGSNERAAIWFRNHDDTVSKVDLGLLTNTTLTRAIWINNRGQVVGWAQGASGMYAFIWVPGWTSVQELRNFLSATDKSTWTALYVATAITDDGTVVGYGQRSGVSYTDGFAIKPKL